MSIKMLPCHKNEVRTNST